MTKRTYYEGKCYLGANIKFFRQRNGMTQAELGKYLGYESCSTVVKWESEKSNPPIETISKISKLFDVTIDDLVYVNPSNVLSSTGTERHSTAFGDEILTKFEEASKERQKVILDILNIDYPTKESRK